MNSLVLKPKIEANRNFTIIRNCLLADTRIAGDPAYLYIWFTHHHDGFLINQTLARKHLNWTKYRFQKAKNILREYGYLIEVIDRWPSSLPDQMTHLKGKPRHRLIVRDILNPEQDGIPQEMLLLKSDKTINNLPLFLLANGWQIEDFKGHKIKEFFNQNVGAENQPHIKELKKGRTTTTDISSRTVIRARETASAPAKQACFTNTCQQATHIRKTVTITNNQKYFKPNKEAVNILLNKKQQREIKNTMKRMTKIKRRFKGDPHTRYEIDRELKEIHPSLTISALEKALDGRLNINNVNLVEAARQVFSKNRSHVESPVDYLAKSLLNSPKRWQKNKLTPIPASPKTDMLTQQFLVEKQTFQLNPCEIIGHNWDYPRFPEEDAYCIRIKTDDTGKDVLCNALKPDKQPEIRVCPDKHDWIQEPIHPGLETSCRNCDVKREQIDPEFLQLQQDPMLADIIRQQIIESLQASIRDLEQAETENGTYHKN